MQRVEFEFENDLALLDSHLGPTPKPDKGHARIEDHKIVTMQNIVGKLL